MIRRNDLQVRATEWMLDERVVEKDYVIGWLLWGLSSDPVLLRTWAFKGGTCLKKCYLETYRFSEDLDFTVMEDGPVLPEEVSSRIESILKRITQESGIEFPDPSRWKQRAGGRSTEGKIYYRGPVGARNLAMVKIDLTAEEVLAAPTVLRAVVHSYPDQLPPPGKIRCYDFHEVFAEKLRALGERCRPRDLYDVINLYRRGDFNTHPELLRETMAKKCQTKGVPLTTWDNLQEDPSHQAELQAEWGNMLGHQLPVLPRFEPFWDELPQMFAWLEGRGKQILPGHLSIAGEKLDRSWTPPPTSTLWGFQIEPIRFAGANHLCVELGYQGKTRLVEPYSLRRTQNGDLLLYALKHVERDIRSYRVDRIQSVKVTPTVFRPAYRIEFSPLRSK